jgi:hypothetical protein
MEGAFGSRSWDEREKQRLATKEAMADCLGAWKRFMGSRLLLFCVGSASAISELVSAKLALRSRVRIYLEGSFLRYPSSCITLTLILRHLSDYFSRLCLRFSFLPRYPPAPRESRSATSISLSLVGSPGRNVLAHAIVPDSRGFLSK